MKGAIYIRLMKLIALVKLNLMTQCFYQAGIAYISIVDSYYVGEEGLRFLYSI